MRRKLVDTSFHLLYDPELVKKAREMRKNPTPTEKKLLNTSLRQDYYQGIATLDPGSDQLSMSESVLIHSSTIDRRTQDTGVGAVSP